MGWQRTQDAPQRRARSGEGGRSRGFCGAVLSPVGLKGARRWRLLWSLQRPLSERSEEMSLSGRQRRGAFKLCWSDADTVTVHSVIEVFLSLFPVVSRVVPTEPLPETLLPTESPPRGPHHTNNRNREATPHTPPVRQFPTAPAHGQPHVPPSGGRIRSTGHPLYLPGRQSHARDTPNSGSSSRLPARRWHTPGYR